MSTTNQINNLITLSTRLAEVIKEENEALAEGRFDDVQNMLTIKTKLARAYKSQVKDLGEKLDALSEVEPQVLNQLRTQGIEADILMKENARLLKLKIEAGRQLIESFAEAVRNQDQGAGTYSAKGALGDGQTAKNAMAISYNQAL